VLEATGDKGTELPAVKAALAQGRRRWLREGGAGSGKAALAQGEGKIVGGDALQTQREVCEQILGQGGRSCSSGEELFVVKGHQPTLSAEGKDEGGEGRRRGRTKEGKDAFEGGEGRL
jgi:hypothetical protein